MCLLSFAKLSLEVEIIVGPLQVTVLKTLPNGPIRKVIILKVKFEDPQKIFPYWVIRAGDLEKFFEKIFLAQMS